MNVKKSDVETLVRHVRELLKAQSLLDTNLLEDCLGVLKQQCNPDQFDRIKKYFANFTLQKTQFHQVRVTGEFLEKIGSSEGFEEGESNQEEMSLQEKLNRFLEGFLEENQLVCSLEERLFHASERVGAQEERFLVLERENQELRQKLQEALRCNNNWSDWYGEMKKQGRIL